MADPVRLDSGAEVKIRNPGMVILWSVITLGIYGFVWYYKINREMRDYGRAKGDEELGKSEPVLSVLAVTLGALIIVPPFVSFYKATQRLQRTQELGGDDKVSGWMIFALVVLGFFTGFAYLAIQAIVQDHLNRIWKQFPLIEQAPASGEIESSADRTLETEKQKTP